MSPWPLCLGLLIPFVVWTAFTQGYAVLQGWIKVPGVLEYYVHGPQPRWAWVGYVHPPLYSEFMNSIAWWDEVMGVRGDMLVLGVGAVSQAATLLLFAWRLPPLIGPGYASLACALVAFSGQWLRPFEHYPLAAFAATLALLGILEFAREPDAKRIRIAVVGVLLAVELHLSTWFLVGGLMAGLFLFSVVPRRRTLRASAWMIGLFLLTTVPGLYVTLFGGNSGDPEGARGGMTLEWSNPWLFLPALLALMPPLAKRAPALRPLGIGILAFAAVTLGLQFFQIADGQPYPFSLHYFELIDSAMALCAAWVLKEFSVLCGERGLPRGLVPLLGCTLVGFQFAYWCMDQRWIYMSKRWYELAFWPF